MTRKTQTFFFLLFLGCLLFQLSSSSVFAQRTTPGSIQRLVNQLDERLQKLETLARQYPNKKLDATIRTIKDYRQKALRDAKAGRIPTAQQELKLAIRLSDSALKQSLTTIRNSLQGELDDQIQKAEALLHQHYNPDADRLLKTAKQLREKAIRAFQNGNYTKANSYLKTEKKVLENCLKLLAKSSPENLAAFQTELQNFQDLRKQADSLLQNARTPLGVSLYHQALEQARKANRSFKKGNVEQATRFYQWATRLMLRAIDLLRGQNSAVAEQAREALTLSQQIVHSTEQQIHGPGAHTGRLQMKLLLQAQNLLRKAQRDFDRENYPLAMQEADVARKLATQLNRSGMGQNADYRNMLQENISEIDQNLQNLRAQKMNSPAAKTLLKLAGRFLNAAKQNLSAGKLQKSAANILVANRLTIQLDKLSQTSSAVSPDFSNLDLQKQFEDLQGHLSEIETSKLTPIQKSYYDLLKSLLKQIAQYLRANQKSQASQLLHIAQIAWQKIQE